MPRVNKRRDLLDQLAYDWAGCRRCELAETRTNIVWWRGSARAKLMAIGEAPGRDEDLSGEPFVGAAGQTLDSLFEEADVPVKKVFITNRIGCRPPKNRKPTVPEMSACRGRLKSMIRIVQPRVLLLMGATAAEMAGVKRAITRHRGEIEEVEIMIDSAVHTYPAVITFHPSFLNRKGGSQEIRDQMVFDIQTAWDLAHSNDQ